MSPDTLEITVDARVELISIVFHLAGNEEYNHPQQLAGYAAAVGGHFQDHRNHPAVLTAARLRDAYGMGYDAPISLAVHLTDARNLGELVDFDERPPRLFDAYRNIPTPEMRGFVEELRRFVRDADFWGFYDAQRSLYDRTVGEVRAVLRDRPLNASWFDAYFGEVPPKTHTLVLAMLNGGNGYGPSARHRGREQAFCVLGVWEGGVNAGVRFLDRSHIVPFAVHEFCHSYVNPLVDERLDEFEGPAKKWFARSQETMAEQAYGLWQCTVYELIVRACVRRYLQVHEDDSALRRDIALNEERGFDLVDGLAQRLEEYENNRARYPGLRSFSPRLVDFFHQAEASLGT